MKKLLTVMLVLLMAVSMAACTPKPQPEDEKATVTIWHSYTKAQKEYLLKAVEEFNASQDKYTVIAQEQEKSGLDDKIYNAVIQGNGPDMYFNYASTAARFTKDNKVVDLSKYLSADLIAQLTPKVKEEATSFADGGMYVFPMVSSGPIFYYNKAVYEELGLKAPQTWDELVANSKAVHDKYPEMAGFAADSRTDIGNTLIYQTGNGLYDPKTQTVLFNTPEVAAQLQMWQDAFAAGYFTDVHSKDDGYCSTQYNKGLIASFIGSAASAPYIGPSQGGAEFACGIVPQGGKVQWTPAWNRGMMVFNYGDEAKIKACVAFIEYFAQPEVNAQWCIACNYPALFQWTKDTATYKEFATKNFTFDYLQADIAGAAPAEGNAIMRTTIDNLLQQVEGGMNVQEALDAAVKFANEELALDK